MKNELKGGGENQCVAHGHEYGCEAERFRGGGKKPRH